jgi:hypothetical protein
VIKVKLANLGQNRFLRFLQASASRPPFAPLLGRLLPVLQERAGQKEDDQEKKGGAE